MEGQKIRPLNTEPLLGHPKYMKVFVPCFSSLTTTDVRPALCHWLLEHNLGFQPSTTYSPCSAVSTCIGMSHKSGWRSTCTGIQHTTIRPSQVADLNRGAFGFVQLAKDVTTGEQVAIKFIERGDKVDHRPAASVVPGYQAHGDTVSLCL